MEGEGADSVVSRRQFVRGAAGGAVVAGATTAGSGVAGAQEGNGTGGNQTGGNESDPAQDEGNATGASAQGGGNQTGGGGAQNEQRQVEMTDQLRFVPESITIAPGDTIEWVNVGSIAHTVTAYADSVPEGADYFASGGFTSEEAARQGFPEGSIEGGDSYSHTFDTAGTYEYFCIPHESAGMVGTVEVVQAGGAGGGGGGEAAGPILPDSAKTIGIATTGALISVLGLAYVFLKYGGDYGEHVEEQ